MKLIRWPRWRCAGPALLLAGLVLAAQLVCPGAARPQNLALPALGLTATPQHAEVVVQWSEADSTAGRQASNITFAAWDTLGVASTVAIVGDYVLDCDYRLRITKIPEDAGFGRRVRFVSQIFRNTTGVGAPLRQVTMQIFAPDSVHVYPGSFAGNLGITVTGNIGAPSGPLGSAPVILRGLNSTSSPTVGYFATALNSVSSLSDGLLVQVSGPVDLTNIPDPVPAGLSDTLLVTTAGQVQPIQDAMSFGLQEGSAAPGDTVTWTAHYLFPADGRITADLEAFEGYHVWRSDLPDLGSFSLLGEIRQCESKFDFVLVDEEEATDLDVELRYDPAARAFALFDRDVHDDFPYRYAVSAFDRGFLGNAEDLTFEGPLAASPRLYPAVQARNPDREIYVVPNPFKRSTDFQESGPRVVFANLPTQCTIRIFTEAADHLATLEHGPGQPASRTPTSREWDLRSDAGLPLAPGIYIFYVEGTDHRGTVTESVAQTGKMIVAR
jgi:hypothetical protein